MSKRPSYASVASSHDAATIKTTEESVHLNSVKLLPVLAECLSEMVTVFEERINSGEKIDELKPFNIVSVAAEQYLKVKITANELFCVGISISPTKALSDSYRNVQSFSSQTGQPGRQSSTLTMNASTDPKIIDPGIESQI